MIIQVYDDDLINGTGVREVVFLQGCHHHCKGCFSPETWEFKKETPETLAKSSKFKTRVLKKLRESYIDGITITGGDPLAPENLKETEELCTMAKAYNKTVWVYSGYTWDKVKDLFIMNLIDVLCEGPFIESLKSPDKPWVGSSNQRVLDVKASLNLGNPTEIK